MTTSAPTPASTTGTKIDAEQELSHIKAICDDLLSRNEKVGIRFFFYSGEAAVCEVITPFSTKEEQIHQHVIMANMLMPTLIDPTCIVVMDVQVELETTGLTDAIVCVISSAKGIINVTYPYQMVDLNRIEWTDDEIAVGAQTYPQSVEHAIRVFGMMKYSFYPPATTVRFLQNLGHVVNLAGDMTPDKLSAVASSLSVDD